jgi:hypothetical protein
MTQIQNASWSFAASKYFRVAAREHTLAPPGRHRPRHWGGRTLGTRRNYAGALFGHPTATLDDLREAVTTLEETVRTARRVLGGAHPLTSGIENNLRKARAALRARETPPPAGAT